MTTAEQRAAALDAANQIRTDRARVRRQIGEGLVPANRVLAEWPECIHGASAFTFLTFMRYVGSRRRSDAESSGKAFVLLRRANCIQVGHKRLDQLTPAQLARLERVVRDYENQRDNRHPAERGIA